MIAPQELKQNNLIRDIQSGRIGAVLTIGEKKCTIKMPFSKLSQSYEDFEPIELNEDWLLKLGFEIEFSDHAFKEAYYGENPVTKDYLINLKNTGDGWFYRNGYFKIKYVHHAQNLTFAITGEELKIKES